MDGTRHGLVVVGYDGSPGAQAALELALHEGVARGCTVEVVTAWLWSSPFESRPRAGALGEGRATGEALQEQALRLAAEHLPRMPVVSRLLIDDYPGKALVARSEGAAMLVVGSGRRSAMNRLLLGSVSEYCVRHALAPVVVVPDPARVRQPPPREVQDAAAVGTTR